MSEASRIDPAPEPQPQGSSAPDAVELAPGEHRCAFYRGSEGLAGMLVPFLAGALRRNEACAAVIDTPATWILAQFDREGAVIRSRARRSLRLVTPAGSCRRDDGFSAGRLLSWLDGTSPTRLVAEMTWALRDATGASRLRPLEHQVAAIAASGPAVLCLYDLDAVDGGTMVEVIRTHRSVLVDGTLVENPFAAANAFGGGPA